MLSTSSAFASATFGLVPPLLGLSTSIGIMSSEETLVEVSSSGFEVDLEWIPSSHLDDSTSLAFMVSKKNVTKYIIRL